MSHNWMPLYIGDYKRDTSHLSLREHGAYVLLIMHYWETGPLPGDIGKIARIVGLTRATFLPIWSSLNEFFVEAYDEQLQSICYRHKRIDRELAKVETISIKRAYAGGRGGLAPRRPRVNHRPNGSQLLSKRGVHITKKERDTLLSEHAAPQQEGATEEVAEARVESPTNGPAPPIGHPLSVSLDSPLGKLMREKRWVR